MNKNTYRLVWNRRHGVLQAVSETARSNSKRSESASRSSQATPGLPLRPSMVARAVIAAILSMSAGSAAWAGAYTVSNSNDSGAGSLRQAITDANGDPGSTINLGSNISFTPASALSTLTATTTITNGNTATVNGGSIYVGSSSVTLSGMGSWVVGNGSNGTTGAIGASGSYVSGGTGDTGGTGGAGTNGASGSLGLSGTGFTLSNGLSLTGGAGGTGGTGGTGGRGGYSKYGHGGTGGTGGIGGTGGNGAAAVGGASFTLTNTGTLIGGNGGAGGAGGAGGGGGGTWTGTPGSSGAAGTAGTGGAGGAGIAAAGNSMIYNAGTISGGYANAGAGARANAIDFSGGGNKLVIEAGSAINGNVVSTSGATNGGDTLALGGNVNAGGGNSFGLAAIGATAQYRGFQNFAKEGTSTWTLTGSGASNWSVAAGTLNLADSMALTGGITVLSGATLSANNASLSGNLGNAGTLTIGANKTLTVGGNFTNSDNFTTTVTDTTYGKLTATGTVTLGGTLTVDASTVTNANTYGGTVSNVISGGSVSGTFASYSDNSALFNFTPVYNANGMNLTLSAATSGSGGTPGVLDAAISQGNTSGIGAARVLDGVIASNPSGSLASLFVPLTNTQSISNAVSQTLPLLTGGSTMAAQSALGSINHVIQARSEANRGLSSGDSFLGDKNFWVKPFGSWADQNERNGVAGYKANSYGLALGIDGTPSDALRTGLAFAYAKSDINGQSSVAPQSVDIDVYQLIGYGSYSLDARTDINFQADIGQNTNKGRRLIAFANSVASSNYDSQTAHFGLGIGRSYFLGGQTSLTPSVRVDYTRIKDKAYSETGAGALNLNVDSRTTEALIIGADGRLAHQLNERTMLAANLGIGYDTINKQAAITAAFAGAADASFVTYGIDPSPWLVRGGVGATYQVGRGVEITGRYDAEYRESFLNQTASVKVRWVF